MWRSNITSLAFIINMIPMMSLVFFGKIDSIPINYHIVSATFYFRITLVDEIQFNALILSPELTFHSS